MNLKEYGFKIEAALKECCEASEKALGLTPFDEQLIAAVALYDGKIVEMKTGEGKTLSAVFAAYLLKLDNRKVHIFTFNDYLAKRDYNWMKPLYDLLNVSIALITEKTPFKERQMAYKNADVVYCTVKEAGFDFLRDFMVYEDSERVHVGYDFAIFDEADSVLIDEARIPLVIAGDVDAHVSDEVVRVCEFVKKLDENDYEIDFGENAVYLTDDGIVKTEEFFELDNLYDEENTDVLIVINTCLKAVFFLKENKDYVVKDNKIQLIDSLTGRIAKNRVLPDALQSAVEVKHGLKVTERGVVTGIIPIQYFARQYKNIAGMTGTAMQSDEEFELLYGLHIEAIAPHNPSNRTNHLAEIYYDGESKWEAVVREIVRVNEKKQPVLIGTATIEESENLAKMLDGEGIDNVRVLNAKNDEMEAEIIKNAGALGAVTVSTNMAGRGIDIKLGSFDETTRDEVVEAGGLFIIGTQIYENARMNEQLNGRCGRQGDVGETKLFVALDDEIMLKHELKKLVGGRRFPDPTKDIIDDRVVVREIERVQRISQGDLLEERKRLLKFTIIGEKHRDIIFSKRLEYLSGERQPDIWQGSQDYKKAVKKFGEEALNALQKEVILSAVNEVWCDYLEYTSELRTGIHLRAIAGRSPAEEYNIDSEMYFEGCENRLIEKVNDTLSEIIKLDKLSEFSVVKPKNTRTYLMEESGDDLAGKPILLNIFEEEEEKDDDNSDGFWAKLFGKKSK
ncbi:MAG: preprotein translocase subunit SecA [Oscillospiraceae bacterium]|nr:preprotein translocase subunit SecA [Oscillospiraceae bacterium]